MGQQDGFSMIALAVAACHSHGRLDGCSELRQMCHDGFVVLLDTAVGRTLTVVALGLLAVFPFHRLLKPPAAVASDFGHRPIMVAQIVLMPFHGFGMRIQRVAVPVNGLLQIRQLGQGRLMLCSPTLDVNAPDEMLEIPLLVIGSHVFEWVGYLFHCA
jgi:hypothetical protein